MQEGVPLPLAAWQNFYVIIGAAAATLTGLIFVVATLVAGVRRRMSASSESFSTFNTPNVAHFSAALLVAALLSAPWPALWMAGLALCVLGLSGALYMVVVFRRARRQTHYQPVLEDWVFHTVLPLAAYMSLLVAAIFLPRDPTPFLFIIAAATLLLLFIGIHNAWDNVAYIAMELYPRQDPSQG